MKLKFHAANLSNKIWYKNRQVVNIQHSEFAFGIRIAKFNFSKQKTVYSIQKADYHVEPDSV